MVSNASSSAAPLRRDLEENAIGLIGAVMQCVTHIAPAIAAFFYTAVVVGYAGVTAPLAAAQPWPFAYCSRQLHVVLDSQD